jgi:RNA polymerase sigma-70 factor (ECF subfamily)
MESIYLRKILAGDISGFSYFIDQYKDMAFSIAFRIVNNREDAEEIVQDSFMKAFRALHTFRHDSKFSTWFYRIVVNQSLTKRARDKTEVNTIDLSKIPDIAVDQLESAYKKMTHDDQKKYINLVLEELGSEDSLLLTLYYLNENSIDEIVEITAITRENVKMKLHRARKKMYGLLEQKLKSEIKNLL